MIRKLKYRPGEKGNSIVEFALTLPILLLVIFGVIHFGRAIMTTNILYTAAREGARAAAIDTTTSYWQPRVNAVLTAGVVRNGRSSVVYLPATRSVVVTVTSYFSVIGRRMPTLIPGGIGLPDSIPLSASAVMKYEK
jgi:Flp pilus assembly protein TadG